MTPTAEPTFRAHLEHPDVLPRQRTFHVQGWIASRQPVVGAVVEGRHPATLILRDRPDVVKALPDFPHCYGFFGVAGREHLADASLTVRFARVGGETAQTFSLRLEDPDAVLRRRQKLERVYPVLVCIRCGSRFPVGGFSAEADVITCAECGTGYDCSRGCFDLLPDELRDEFAPKSGDNVSANHYDASAITFIEEGRDGLLLDCGAGFRTLEYPHVVNLEVVAYKSTDVLGFDERLPFADASFDGVLSLAVLEHLRNPFAAAREICRVLKPGGKLLAVAPLLAPVHAYPHHYYNMTSQGLVNLFASDVDVIETRVPDSGLPIWSLVWCLRSWARGLDGAAKESFLNLRVSDLLGEAEGYLDRDFVTALGQDKRFELATTTLLYGRKRP